MKLTIEKAIYGGAGLARHEGQAIFVPCSLPGEVVEAEVRRSKGSYAEAELKAILQPSQQRIEPRCRHFGACGGCHYQHADYGEQVRIKTAILAETLQRARIENLPEIEPLTAAPFEYRNRIRLHVQAQPFALGYMRGQSHALLAIEECPIAAPVLVRIVRVLVADCAGELAGWAREVELFTDAAGEQVLVSVFAPAETASLGARLQALWPRLQAAAPEVAGCAVFAAPQGKGFAKLAAQAGATHLSYAAAGTGYRVGAGSFFQVNRFLLDRMVVAVCGGRQGQMAWDLYAGVGLFARQLEGGFAQVAAVEAAPGSVSDLRTNARGLGTRIVAASTRDFLQRAVRERAGRPDFVVVDPPRAGLGAEVTQLLSQIGPPHITYVSCDPSTLSRDLSALLLSGYRLRGLQLVDLFPQTFHLETIAQLRLE
jgi:23S rRNA (uracil1939-C5)-methyltransferase